ncbi:elongation factor Ts [candidate division KSB1 bacterium 4484_219]|nr:MAG: elongation factor Ts [candidate division KSB1 bacterium 4484_219]RKY88740.1 MAG: elongation factor Ts [candidate division KSB1 bacterium]
MEVSAEMVKQLREQTGAGIMDCKKALQENNGDFAKAMEYLRKKGIVAAQKRSTRETGEGIIDAYIHPGSRLGVLIEVNCETDFVANTSEFRRFVRDMAMQVAASNPLVISREQLAPEIIEREMEIYRTQAKESGKPDHVVEKIVQGKVEKFYQDVCLLEQSYIRDPEKTVQDVLTEITAKLGENIQIKRFVRFHLGEDQQK